MTGWYQRVTLFGTSGYSYHFTGQLLGFDRESYFQTSTEVAFSSSHQAISIFQEKVMYYQREDILEESCVILTFLALKNCQYFCLPCVIRIPHQLKGRWHLKKILRISPFCLCMFVHFIGDSQIPCRFFVGIFPMAVNEILF